MPNYGRAGSSPASSTFKTPGTRGFIGFGLFLSTDFDNLSLFFSVKYSAKCLLGLLIGKLNGDDKNSFYPHKECAGHIDEMENELKFKLVFSEG